MPPWCVLRSGGTPAEARQPTALLLRLWLYCGVMLLRPDVPNTSSIRALLAVTVLPATQREQDVNTLA